MDQEVQEVDKKTFSFRASLTVLAILALFIAALAIAVATVANSKASSCTGASLGGRRLELKWPNNTDLARGPRCLPVVSCYSHEDYKKLLRKEAVHNDFFTSKHEL